MKIDKKGRIVIIGAGVSGIAAAAKLFENGFTDVTILEAEDRIGGRIHTVKLGNYNIDLGAQWLQGTEGSIVFDLAKPYDLLEISKKDLAERMKWEYFDSQGNLLSDELNDEFHDFHFKCLAEQPYKSDAKEVCTGFHLMKSFKERFENSSAVMERKIPLLNYLERSISCVDPAESWLDISTSHLFKSYEGDQLVNWKDQGFSTIFDLILKRYPNPEDEIPVLSKTILNSEVTLIDYSMKNDSSSVLVSTKNGRTFEADHVIVTVSLGVLKEKHNTLFKPPLPYTKTKTIQTLGFGSVAKIFLLFDKPFWERDGEKISVWNFLWNEADMKTIENDHERSWLLGLYRAHTVEYKPNLLELWITGKYAKEMEFLAEDKVLMHCEQSLQRFLGKKFKVTRPAEIKRTQWFTNPHFKGTYIYRTVKSQKLGLGSDEVEEPVTPENLTVLFAGEATSRHRYATVDGAIVSGRKTADQLINYYKHFLN